MVTLERGDVLIVADIQNDFLPGGALGVPRGHDVVPVLVRYMERFAQRGNPIYVTKDWHPPNHCSFKEGGGIWPVHCVAGSAGAEHPADFHVPASARPIDKATHPDREAYSAFEGTGLGELLKGDRARRLFVGGLATDYCVLNTVKDAVRQGYQVFLLSDGIRAVNVHPADGDNAVHEMLALGAIPITLNELNGDAA